MAIERSTKRRKMLSENISLRFRAVVQFDAGLMPGEYECFGDMLHVISTPDAKTVVVEVTVPQEEEERIREAYVHAQNKVERFIDVAAMVGYCGGMVRQVISLVPERVALGDKFKMVTPGPLPARKLAAVTPADLSAAQDHEAGLAAAGLLRQAFSTTSIEERVLSIYSAMERLAHRECKERQVVKCDSCGAERDLGPASAQFIRRILRENGATESDARDFRKARSKVAHGDATRDVTYLQRLETEVAGLEGAALAAVAARLGLTVQNQMNLAAANPIVIWEFEAMALDFCLVSLEVESDARGTRVRQEGSVRGTGEVFWGVPTNILLKTHIHPAAWPAVIKGDGT